MLAVTGRLILDSFASAGRATMMVAALGWRLHTLHRSLRLVARQADMAGVGSVLVLMLISGLTGMIMVMQTAPSLEPYGALDTLGPILGFTFTRELGPIWAAMIILSRVGSAMAAEIGTMVVNEEVEALRVMDIDPVRYLVLPRVVALILVMPFLTVIADVVGLFGGSIVAQSQYGVPIADFWRGIGDLLGPMDLISGIVKSLVFALLIGVIACDQGLSCKGDAEGVGRVTTNAVRLSVIFVLLSDLIITALFRFSLSGTI